MLNNNVEVYAIPGWGFSSGIFNCLKFDDVVIKGLDYFDVPVASFEALAEHIAKDIPDNCAIVAWSFGGLLAIKIARLFPKKVIKLMLISSQPRFLTDESWQGVSVEHADKFIFQFSRNVRRHFERFISLVSYPEALANNQVLLKHCLIGHVDKLLPQLTMLFNYDLRSEYQCLSCDVLHVLNGKDAIINQSRTQLLALNAKVNTITVEAAGHAGFITHSNIYKKIIRDVILL